MPRVYAKVSIEMWGDYRFLQLSPLKPSAQGLWVYLLTGHFRTSIPGLNLRIGIGALSDRLKWRIVEVERCWEEIAALKMAEADWRAGVVWLPKGIEHNEPESPNVIKGWGKVVLPECRLIEKVLTTLEAYITERLSRPYAKAFQYTFRETCRHPSPNQEQEQEQEVPPYPPRFAKGVRALTRQERKTAEHIRRSQGGCRHEPACESYAACVERIGQEIRVKGAA